jgi:hypothetical protein
MYQDISKIIAISGAPATYMSPDNTIHDIGQAIFANAPDVSSLTAGPNDDTPIQTLSFNFPNKAGTLLIKGTHVYCDVIPMGIKAADTAWHVAVHIETSMTQSFKDEFDKEMVNFSVISTDTSGFPNGPSSGVEVLRVNLTISWANVPYAQKLYASSNSVWASNYPTYKVRANTLTGHLQLLQVNAPLGISPHQVRETVNYSASTSI